MTSAPDERTVIAERGIAPGTRLNGIYEIERFLGAGGMGDVYRGRAIETGDPVAIKLIKREHAANEQVLALFRREAAALHRIRHEAIVHYYVFTTDPDLRTPYMAMEFVEGEPLAAIVRRGPMPVETVIALAGRLASGLEAAHRMGVVHRDLAPDNILLPDGDPAKAKIIDFGIARNPAGGSTVIGSQFAGKLNFASPEQVGLFGGEVGPPSDVYSLALVLAAALAGNPLDMGGTQFDMVRKRQVVPPLQDFDPSIQPLLIGMLSPDPADRPTMAEVAAWRPSTTRAAADKPAAKAAPKPSAAAPAEAPSSGRSRAIAAVFGGLLVLAGGGGLALWSFGDPSADAPVEVATRTPPQAPLLPPDPPPASPTAAPAPTPAPAPQPTPSRAPEPAPRAPAPPVEVVQRPTSPEPPAPAPTPPVVPIPAAPAPAPLPAPAPVPVPAPAPPVIAIAPAPAPPAPAPAPAAPARTDAGEALPPGVVRDCTACPQLVEIPGGTFQMGSNADPTEKPVRRVNVGEFALGRFPVTVAEWRVCAAEGACAFKAEVGAPEEPVHNISATDGQQYLAWLSRVTGKPYRLPTEAEWEYAARAGTTTRYWWGDAFQPKLSGCRGCGAGSIASPPAVGRFKPNPFGLSDMTGTVSQWTADCWHKDYRGAPSDGSAWLQPRCRERVLRGGSWQNEPNALGVSTREFYDGNIRYPGNGLRVARDR